MLSISERILSLDVFRGLTIVLMILVNSQSASSYPILLHADWHGCSLADLVFPSFLFIVGITIVVALDKQRAKKTKTVLYGEIVKRSILLFLIGIFLAIFPLSFSLSSLRIYGILQRIALCYLVCALIYLNTKVKTQIILFLALVVVYWLVMTQIPVPGFGTNQLTPSGSWVAYFDQMIFSSTHLYGKTYDPEGFLSTFPSIATTLFGVVIGQLLLSNQSKQEKFIMMLALSVLLLILGALWDNSFPINKNLWTSSFVFWTSGLSLIVFVSCFGLVDILGYQQWSLPFKIFGMNALFAFILHVLLLKLQATFKVSTQAGALVNIKTLLTERLFSHFSAPNASLLYSLVFIGFNFLVVLFLYKRKLFIRI